jgi:hypothetical protein
MQSRDRYRNVAPASEREPGCAGERGKVHKRLVCARFPSRCFLEEATLLGSLLIPKLVADRQCRPPQVLASLVVARPGVVGQEVRRLGGEGVRRVLENPQLFVLDEPIDRHPAGAEPGVMLAATVTIKPEAPQFASVRLARTVVVGNWVANDLPIEFELRPDLSTSPAVVEAPHALNLTRGSATVSPLIAAASLGSSRAILKKNLSFRKMRVGSGSESFVAAMGSSAFFGMRGKYCHNGGMGHLLA